MAFGDRPGERSHFYLRDAFADDRLAGFQARQHTYIPAVIGAELARRYGEKPVIVHAIEAHHADVDPNTVLDVLVQAADAVSASRPGARRESAENYIKRLEKLEEIANSHDGVERTYAMQAGREVHVMVQPDKISDGQYTVLAHDIAHQIEEEMEYPGQVRVVVIRESRAVDIAK